MQFKSSVVASHRESKGSQLNSATSTKSILPPLIKSFNERKAHYKNRLEQTRLEKLLDQLEVQERVYVQLFRREKQVVELRQARVSLIHSKTSSLPCGVDAMPPFGRSLRTLSRSMSLPDTITKPMGVVRTPEDAEGPVEDRGVGEQTVGKRDVAFLHRERQGSAESLLARRSLLQSQYHALDLIPDAPEELTISTPGALEESVTTRPICLTDTAACLEDVDYSSLLRRTPDSAGFLRPISASGRLFPDTNSSGNEETEFGRGLRDGARGISANMHLLPPEASLAEQVKVVEGQTSQKQEDIQPHECDTECFHPATNSQAANEAPEKQVDKASTSKASRHKTASAGVNAKVEIPDSVKEPNGGKLGYRKGTQRSAAEAERNRLRRELRESHEHRRHHDDRKDRFDVGGAIDKERVKYGAEFLPRLQRFVSQFSCDDATITAVTDLQHLDSTDGKVQ